MSLRVAIIVETHPEDHSVDLVMLDDGSRHIGVQVLAQNASARTGTLDMPKIVPPGDKWDITKTNGQDMKAVVAFVGRTPVVVGTLFPQVNQVLLKDPEARRYRHQSDVETLIDGAGNMQITHPSGTYIRIGETTAADTLAGKHADDNATDRNTGKRVNIHIGMAGGALELTMTPGGAVALRCNQGVTVDAGQGVTVKAPSVTLDTPNTTLTGNLTVQGSTSLQAVTSRGKNISSTHVHTGVMSGVSNTGTPP
jgi:hypothetical protein